MPKTLNKLAETIVLVLALIFAASCASERARVVMIQPIVTHPETLVPSDLLRVGPGLRGRIYFPSNGGWELSDNEIDLPEGWYLVPPPPKGEENE